MAIPLARETLAARAIFLRESLRKSQANTEEMVTTLGSFDHRLSALDAAMRPTQVRTHGVRRAHENIDKTLQSADGILIHFDVCRQAETKILKGPHEDLESYLEAIDQLRICSVFFKENFSFRSSDGMLNHINTLLANAVSNLEEEFRQLLSSYSQPVERAHLFDCLPQSLQPSSESTAQQGDSNSKTPNAHSEHEEMSSGTVLYKLPTLMSPRILPLLHDLAQQLAQARRQLQCLEIYRETRGSALEQTLRKLGVEKLSADDVQKMQWKVLEAKIASWIHYIRIAVKLLFAGERTICDQIFEGIDRLRDQCFAEVTFNSVQMLLGFGGAVTKGTTRAPEKLFAFLDMYEIMQELQSEIATIFEDKACSTIRESALSLMKHLAQTVQETLNSFQQSIEKDSIKAIFPDGKVHPVTSYVMNYLKYLLLEHESSLKLLFQEFETVGVSTSQLKTMAMGIIQALLSNLDLKSKQYKDPALTHLFLMNNIHYIVTSVRKSEVKDLLGDDWVQIHRRIVQQNANQYKRVAWAKVFSSLSLQAGGSSGGGYNEREGSPSSGASRETVKERFRSFNIQFEELHQRQSEWTVPDVELRETLRLMIAEVLQPAYRSFLKRYGSMIENSRYADRFIKYTPENLDLMLGDFFEGKTRSEQRK